MNKTRLAVVTLASAAALVAGSAFAAMDLQKEVLKKYPDSKVKCGSCHTKAMPKKGENDSSSFPPLAISLPYWCQRTCCVSVARGIWARIATAICSAIFRIATFGSFSRT